MSKFKCTTCGDVVEAIADEAFCGNEACKVRRRVTGEGSRSFLVAMVAA